MLLGESHLRMTDEKGLKVRLLRRPSSLLEHTGSLQLLVAAYRQVLLVEALDCSLWLSNHHRWLSSASPLPYDITHPHTSNMSVGPGAKKVYPGLSSRTRCAERIRPIRSEPNDKKERPPNLNAELEYTWWTRIDFCSKHPPS